MPATTDAAATPARRIVILPPHDRWGAWTTPPDPDEPDREETFRILRGLGYDFRRLDIFGRPWNPLARAQSVLAALDPLRALRVLLLHRRADAVLCFFESSAVLLLLLRRLLRFRGRVVIYDIGAFGGSRLRDRLLRVAAARADMILAFGRPQLASLLALGAAPDRLRHVLTLTYPAFFAAAPDCPDGYVLAVGDDVSRDYDTLLQASPGFGRHLVIRSRVVRVDPLAFPDVEVHAASLGTTRYRDLLAGAALVVLPLRETPAAGGVTTLLEAMASAKAVVVSRSSGLAEYLQDGVTCRVVPAGDVAALQAAVRALLADPAERTRLATNARRFVEERCSPRANAAMLYEVLHTMTSSTSQVRRWGEKVG